MGRVQLPHQLCILLNQNHIQAGNIVVLAAPVEDELIWEGNA